MLINKHFRLTVLTAASIFTFTSLFAQDLTTPLLEGTWQSTYANPAQLHQLPGRLTIGLPGAYNDLFVENFTYNDLVVDAEGQRFLDASAVVPLLGQNNELRDQFDFETLGISWRNDRWAFGLHHRLRYDAQLDYPKTLAQLIWEGNAQFVGQTVDFAPDFRLTGYHELGLSVAFQPVKVLSIGARVNFISGITDLSTPGGGSLALTTGEENYALSLEQDYLVNSAGSLEYDGLETLTTNLNFAELNFDKFLGANRGMSIDLGVTLDLGNLRLQAAAQGLGGDIEWTEDVRNYTLSGTSDFAGLDVLESLLQDSVSFQGLTDSLEARFNPQETTDRYRSDLNQGYMLGANFDLNDRLTLGGLLFYQDRLVDGEVSALVSARYSLLDNLMVGATYGYRAGSAANIGINATAKLGPVVCLFATDNIMTAFRLRDSNRANVRLGISLSLFGDDG